MAKSQDVLTLARHALDRNQEMILLSCKCIVANEKEGSSLAKSLSSLLSRPSKTGVLFGEILPPDLKGLVLHMQPKLILEDVTLPGEVDADLKSVLAEYEHSELLQQSGFMPSNRILLSGPPGNGKTVLAGAIAEKLGIPLFVADYTRLLGSHLGESGSNLGKVFRGAAQQPCVLFMDEMETLLAERNSKGSDVGEMARIVSTLLLEIDRLPSDVILIGATNHDEMLDKAVVRRFDHHWRLPRPEQSSVESWLNGFARAHPNIPVLDNKAILLADIGDLSFSDVEKKVTGWCKQWLIESVEFKATKTAVSV